LAARSDTDDNQAAAGLLSHRHLGEIVGVGDRRAGCRDEYVGQ
jgi:hypothetical protein